MYATPCPSYVLVKMILTNGAMQFERGTISYMVTATLTRPTSISPTVTCEAKVSLMERLDIGLLIPPREQKVTMQTMRKRPKRKKTNMSAKSAPLVKVSSAPPEVPDSSPDRDHPRTNTTDSVHLVHGAIPDEATTAEQGAATISRSPIASDIQSEFSGDSAISNNSGSMSGRGADGSGESVAGSRKSKTDDHREITATVELLKGGCLPGDHLPVKIRIEHNRRLKSMHGIIVTFYRQGRVDYAPPAHLFSDMSKEDALKLEREDYYPRSRTGLGGLSLSSAGSCSVFRKDLSQTVAPLIIDPATLTANITTSVRVPEDVFPSIKGVPGGMINFKYHVEVIVDLGGKLAGPSSGGSQHPALIRSLSLHGVNSSSPVSPYEGKNIGSWNPTIVDTDHLRREKGVISVTFEAVVGTTDSSRSRGKQVARPILTVQPVSSQNVLPGEREDPEHAWHEGYNNGEGEWSGQTVATAAAAASAEPHGQNHQSQSPQPQPQGYYPPVVSPQTSYYDFQGHHEQRPHAPTPAYVPPPPEIQVQTGLSEKERVRQAEQRLLPSQPMQQPSEERAESAAAAAGAGPSAPSHDLDVGVGVGAGVGSAPTPRFDRRATLPQSPTHGGAVTPDDADPAPTSGSGATMTDEGPSAPTLADLSQGGPSSHTDDKQELERRRLMEEASAPPEVPEDIYDDDRSTVAGPSAPPPLVPASLPSPSGLPVGPSAPPMVDMDEGPSAPVLDEEHAYEHDHEYHSTAAYGARDPLHNIGDRSSGNPTDHHHHHGHEPLPRYER